MLKCATDERRHGENTFGLPVVVTDAVMPGTAIVGPMPTWEDVLRYGSLEKAIEARANEYSKLTGLDDPVLNAEENWLMSQIPQESDLTGTMKVNEAGHVVIATDRPQPPPLNVSRETIESIKRTLYNAIDKLERMASDKR